MQTLFRSKLGKKIAGKFIDKVSKGMKLLLKGEFVQNRWLAKDGSKKSTIKFIADNLEIIDLKKRPVLSEADSFA